MADILDQEDFDISKYLELICKKKGFYDDQTDRLQLDFIVLQKKLVEAQNIQQKTCEQIVEFVDQHRQRFIEINGQLNTIENKVKKSENILKLLSNRISEYKSEYYLTQSKIQRFINEYELRLIKNQVMSLVRSQSLFLLKFNNQFEKITNSGIMEVNLTQKYLIARFTYKLGFIKVLFDHHIVKEQMSDSQEMIELVNNLGDEFQFYLGEQLAKYQGLVLRETQQVEKDKIGSVLSQIRGWYMNLGKQEEYFRIIERNTMEREMQTGEKELLANKSHLLSGRESQIMENVFTSIFSSVASLPQSHPKQRIKHLLFAFFKKEQLKFLYTYAMPIFPLAYRSYFNALDKAGLKQWLFEELKDHHGWNLKMWIHVRQKNIGDRSANDTDMLKWVQIIFKNQCMLPGTLSQFTKLIFKIVNRYLSKVVEQQFVASSFNRLIQQLHTVGSATKQKILLNSPHSQSIASKIQLSINNQFKKSIDIVLSKNLHNISNTCFGSLQPVKSFVTKIIKKDKDLIQNNTINKSQNIFKPLQAFIKNNNDLDEGCIKVIQNFVEKQVVKYYDTHYAPEILTYSKDNLIAEQVSLVMEVVGRERITMFKTEQSKQ